MSLTPTSTQNSIKEHKRYLQDSRRLRQYGAALSKIISPGAVVVDLGAGTGILGLLALQCGAAKVYALDSTGMLEVCRAVAGANGFGDRVIPLRGQSRDLELPERADVVVCDQLAPMGFEAGLIECLVDAKQRLLKPGGHLMPRAVRFYLAQVTSPRLYASVSCWETSVGSLALSGVRSWAANSLYWEDVRPDELPLPPQLAGCVTLAEAVPATLELAAAWTAGMSGVMHGLGGWFEAALTEDVAVTNGPLAKEPIDREQTFLPLESPLDFSAGDRLSAQVRIVHEQRLAFWQIACDRVDGTREVRRQSTLQGMFLGKEDLGKMRPDFQPKLTAKGAALKSVLELCDGGHALREIEAEVLRRHPEAFRSKDHAAVFVAEALSHLSR
ncbi:MAG: methyltransferase domain-containing protein [Planctomycetota bacterium]|nr:methyltransferase domain-containing protein [Planctomycetota bacterium]